MKRFYLMLLLCLAGCSDGNHADKKEKPPVNVVLAEAISKSVPYYVSAIGNTEAYSTVDITPQVSGKLTGYYFTDGQDVKKGDLIFTIDPDLYQAELEEAQGQLVQAKSNLDYQKQRVDRYKGLLPEDYVSKLDYLQYLSDAGTAKGQVIQYKGSVDKAEVNLDYCTIKSPIDGRCGRHLVDPGNVVRADQEQPLVTINQITPLYLLFTVAEKFLPMIQKYQAEVKGGVGHRVYGCRGGGAEV